MKYEEIIIFDSKNESIDHKKKTLLQTVVDQIALSLKVNSLTSVKSSLEDIDKIVKILKKGKALLLVNPITFEKDNKIESFMKSIESFLTNNHILIYTTLEKQNLPNYIPQALINNYVEKTVKCNAENGFDPSLMANDLDKIINLIATL